MIGTVILWLYWPSFNAGQTEGAQQARIVINTYLSIAASCATAFLCSKAIHRGTRFDMEHAQNATLA